MGQVVGVETLADIIIRSGGAGNIWATWFDHFYQAKGAGSYATSLLDLVGAANLFEGNGAVPWAAGTGWGFVTAAAQWLDTGLTAAIDQSWSILIQYANAAGVGVPAGSSSGANRRFGFYLNPAGGNVQYRNGNNEIVAPFLAAGNLGIGGNLGYRDGIQEGAAIGVWAGVNTQSIFIGAIGVGGIGTTFTDADIYAVGIKEGPALTAGEVAAAAAAMAAL